MGCCFSKRRKAAQGGQQQQQQAAGADGEPAAGEEKAPQYSWEQRAKVRGRGARLGGSRSRLRIPSGSPQDPLRVPSGRISPASTCWRVKLAVRCGWQPGAFFLRGLGLFPLLFMYFILALFGF